MTLPIPILVSATEPGASLRSLERSLQRCNRRTGAAAGEALEGLGVVPADRPERIQALTARAWRGILAPAEPSSDTPVVLLPGMWSGLPGQVLKPACLKLQAASALTSPHSSAGGGFSVPAGFSRDRWRRRNHLQLRRLVVCFQRHLQAHDPGPPSAPLAGDFLFQVADKPNRYQGRHHSPQPSNVGT
jgi:hypothetical protein